jgi:nucleoside phosphorylase
MIKVLIIDDEHEKRRVISNAVLPKNHPELVEIAFAGDAHTAKKLIKSTRFDFIILDINLPKRPDLPVSQDGGLEVLSYIKNNHSANAPAYLVGLTAHDKSEAIAETEFSSPLWKLVRFSYQDTRWQESLENAVTYLIDQKQPPFFNDGHNFHIDLAIITGLEEELASVLELPGNWSPLKVPYDSTPYFQGTFLTDEKKVNVIAASAPQMGMPSSAVLASKLIHNFRPRILCMVGICAGVREKSELGDILIADPCFDWGSGKWNFDQAQQRVSFRPAQYQFRLDETLRADVKELARDRQLISQMHKEFAYKKPVKIPNILVDAMASGASVLQAKELVDDVRIHHKNLVGIEMESYAVFTAAQLAAEPRPKCISIKAVCDFGEEDKADDFHEYAAYISASFLYQLALRSFHHQEI